MPGCAGIDTKLLLSTGPDYSGGSRARHTMKLRDDSLGCYSANGCVNYELTSPFSVQC